MRPSDPFVAERVAIAGRIEVVYVAALLGLVALLPIRQDVSWVDGCLYASTFLLLGAMRLLRPRLPALAGFVGGFGFIAVVTFGAWFRQGLGSGVTSAAYALAVVVGGLLWGPHKTVVLALIASVGAALLAWHAPLPARAPLRSWSELTAILITMAVFVELLFAALGTRIDEVRSSRKRFQQLFDGSPDALVVLDKRAVVQLTNGAARKLLGSDVAPGTPLDALPLFRDANSALLPVILGVDVNKGIQRLPTDSQDAELSLAPGRYHELTVSALSAVSGEHDELLLVTIRDVTEAAAARRTRRDFEAELAKSKSLEALGRLAGGVAHDFNNLLTVIIGTTDLLMETPNVDEQVKDDLEGIRSSATKAAELTSQLLAFGRKQVLESVVFDPNDGLRQLQPLLERLVPSNIVLTIRLSPTLTSIRTDPARLDQVLVNLVTNACDSMPNGGNLLLETTTVTLERDEVSSRVAESEPDRIGPGRYVSLAVSDTGTGMSAETLARIFEPFFTTKGLGKGTGLGLAAVFGVVRQSGGHIRVTSELGVGTRFELLFPEASSDADAHAALRPRERTPALRILLVESTASVRCKVAQMLESSHRAVSVATSAERALELARTQPFDVLLCDATLPEASGAELAAAVCRVQPRLQVLLMTNGKDGHSLAPAARSPSLAAKLHRLNKPFTQRLLDDKLAELSRFLVEPTDSPRGGA